jgi:hypothetical protein
LQAADYPGVIPYDKSKKLLGRELSFEERSVRGTLVANLTNSDMGLLDVFEGNVCIGLEQRPSLL